MASTPRYEMERSRYLLAGADRSRTRARRAQTLERRAKEQGRRAAGAERDGFHEARLASPTREFIARNHGFKSLFWRLLGVGFLYFVIAVTVGIAVVVGRLLYRLLDWQAPRLIKRFGSPRPWWGYLAAVVVGGIAYLMSVVFDWSDDGSLYIATQLVMGVAYMGYLIRAWGWLAVKVHRDPKADEPQKYAPALPAVAAPARLGPSLPHAVAPLPNATPDVEPAAIDEPAPRMAPRRPVLPTPASSQPPLEEIDDDDFDDDDFDYGDEYTYRADEY